MRTMQSTNRKQGTNISVSNANSFRSGPLSLGPQSWFELKGFKLPNQLLLEVLAKLSEKVVSQKVPWASQSKKMAPPVPLEAAT